MKKLIITATLIMTIIALFVTSCAPAPSRGDYPTTPERPAEPIPMPTSAPNYLYDGETEPFYNGENYLDIRENDTQLTEDKSMLTLSLKVDTASYSNVSRYIMKNGQQPPKDAVRTEELINYFSYDGKIDFKDSPIGVYTEVAPSPFKENKFLAFLRVKARDIDKRNLPPSNLTFLIDVSGSMDSYDKLPLLKTAFTMLVEKLTVNDRVSIVIYASGTKTLLDGVNGGDKSKILGAIDSLKAGGSTNGEQAIQRAYRLATENFISGGNNRVILATDGDFNVGISSNSELSRFISDKRDSGVYLSILGFGMGNIRDDLMETLSKDGNGNYSYIDSTSTAQKVLVDELSGNLFVVADDVKAQVEFNPENVASYRLIGYENRALSNRDFKNDAKDAGELGAGSDVVILFELELKDGESDYKYKNNGNSELVGELFELRVRYKDPGQSEGKQITAPFRASDISSGSSDLKFAGSVAAFGDLLRNSEYASVRLGDIETVARENLGYDNGGYKRDFIELLEAYKYIG